MGRLGLGLARGGRRRPASGTPAPSPAPFSAVAADGWQATVASPTDLSMLAASVSRQGFDPTGAATTHVDTFMLTKRVRQAYPNQASFTADQIALSDYVYATDTIAGATNNSAETSPKPVAAWGLPDRQIVGDTVAVEVVAFHRNARAGKQVACIVVRATDGITTVSATVAAATISPLGYDRNAVLVYRATLDIANLSDNADIIVNARVYPWIGGSGSVLDSADYSDRWAFSPRTYRRNVARAANPPLVYVAPGGNDTTGYVGTDPALAAASPCATLNGAAARARTVLGTSAGALDGLRIRLAAGNWSRSGSWTANTVNATIVIEPAPGVSKASCVYEFGAANNSFNLSYWTVKGCTVRRMGANAERGSSAWYEDCAIEFNGNTATPIGINTLYLFWVGCDFGTTAANLSGTSACINALFRGCASSFAGQHSAEFQTVLGNAFDKVHHSPVTGRNPDRCVIAFNKLMKISGANRAFTIGGSDDVTGAAFVQNLVEYVDTVSTPGLSVSPDGAAGDNAHVILHHNTCAGAYLLGRANLFYDEGPTARTSKLMSCKGNIHIQINTKSDVFRGVNESGGDASSRIGNFAYEHGVGCDGEFSQYIDANNGGNDGSFKQEYPGPNASIGTNNSVRNDPLFTDYRGTTYNGSSYSAGAGGGTYTLQAGSPCIGRLPVAVLPFNLAGNVRPTNADNTGCY